MVETLRNPSKKTKPDLTLVPPGVGHNGDLPDPDKILVFAGRQMELLAEKKVVGKKIEELHKQMKNAGIPVAALKEGMDIYEKGIDTAFNFYRMVIHISKALGSPLGYQMKLFDDPKEANPSRQSELEVAYDKGKILGLLGKDADTQAFPSNTDIGQEHLKGWFDGQKFRRDEFERNAEAVNAAEQEKKDYAAAKAKKLAAKAEKKASSAKGQAEKLVREAVEDLDTETAIH